MKNLVFQPLLQRIANMMRVEDDFLANVRNRDPLGFTFGQDFCNPEIQWDDLLLFSGRAVLFFVSRVVDKLPGNLQDGSPESVLKKVQFNLGPPMVLKIGKFINYRI